MTEPSAFFEQDGARFIPSVLTRGPWGPEHQHGGPPSALMARAIEDEAESFQLARFTIDFVQPVPIAPLTVRVEQVRAGRRARPPSRTRRVGRRDPARATGTAARAVRTLRVPLLPRERRLSHGHRVPRGARAGGFGARRTVDVPARASPGRRGTVARPTHSSHG